MGQRLVIQINDGGNPLASAYYHWSAYTESAAEMTSEVLGWLDIANEKFTPIQKAVWALYKTGARFAPMELVYMTEENISKENFTFAFDGRAADRNDGLISVSKQGIDENICWAEGTVTIDISFACVHFDVFYKEPKEEFEEDYDDVNFEDLPMFDMPTYGSLHIDEWYDFYEKLKQLVKQAYGVRSSDGKTACMFIC